MDLSTRLFGSAVVSVALSTSAHFLASIPSVALILANQNSRVANAFAYGIFGDVIIPSGIIGLTLGGIAFLLVLLFRRLFLWRPRPLLILLFGLFLCGATIATLRMLYAVAGGGGFPPASTLVAVLAFLTWVAIPALGAGVAMTVLPLLSEGWGVKTESVSGGKGAAGEISPMESSFDRDRFHDGW
ncbi:hypothetical protein [Streptomyces sp. NPDC094032]|uniref:hypothetical protein n=1 Tax=Streptomyces sp. NPDC094032 TaxID=3155308 RepID=UPI00332FA520